jgi:hypothetical protein
VPMGVDSLNNFNKPQSQVRKRRHKVYYFPHLVMWSNFIKADARDTAYTKEKPCRPSCWVYIWAHFYLCGAPCYIICCVLKSESGGDCGGNCATDGNTRNIKSVCAMTERWHNSQTFYYATWDAMTVAKFVYSHCWIRLPVNNRKNWMSMHALFPMYVRINCVELKYFARK